MQERGNLFGLGTGGDDSNNYQESINELKESLIEIKKEIKGINKTIENDNNQFN